MGFYILYYILFGYSRVNGIFIILQLLGMGIALGLGFLLLNSKSYLVHGPLCGSFNSIQLRFVLPIKVEDLLSLGDI